MDSLSPSSILKVVRQCELRKRQGLAVTQDIELLSQLATASQSAASTWPDRHINAAKRYNDFVKYQITYYAKTSSQYYNHQATALEYCGPRSAIKISDGHIIAWRLDSDLASENTGTYNRPNAFMRINAQSEDIKNLLNLFGALYGLKNDICAVESGCRHKAIHGKKYLANSYFFFALINL